MFAFVWWMSGTVRCREWWCASEGMMTSRSFRTKTVWLNAGLTKVRNWILKSITSCNVNWKWQGRWWRWSWTRTTVSSNWDMTSVWRKRIRQRQLTGCRPMKWNFPEKSIRWIHCTGWFRGWEYITMVRFRIILPLIFTYVEWLPIKETRY